MQDGIRKGAWTQEEDRIIIQQQALLGNQWAVITKMLPGRTDNAVKNRWHAANRLQNRLISMDALPESFKADAARGTVAVIKANMDIPPTSKAFSAVVAATRRHPLVPSLNFASAGTVGSEFSSLNSALLDLRIHGHDHSHDHEPTSNRTSEAPSSSRGGGSARKYYFELAPSGCSSLNASPRIDMLATMHMDDDFINSCLPCHRYTFSTAGSGASTLPEPSHAGRPSQEFGTYRDPFNDTSSSTVSSSGSDCSESPSGPDCGAYLGLYEEGGPAEEDCELMRDLFVISELDAMLMPPKAPRALPLPLPLPLPPATLHLGPSLLAGRGGGMPPVPPTPHVGKKEGVKQNVQGLSPRTTPRSPACPRHIKRLRNMSPRVI